VKQRRSKPQLTVISNSEVQTFRDCGQKWAFAYVERLRPKTVAPPLSFGSAIHAGLAAGYLAIAAARTRSSEATLPEVLDAAEGATRRYREAWEPSSEQSEEEGAKAFEVALWMIRHYWQTHERDLRTLVPLGVEVPFQAPLIDSMGRRIAHLQLAGVIDLIAYDTEAKDLVVVDHKTTSAEVSTIDRRVEMDPQMAGYLWAVREYIRQGRILSLLSVPPSLRDLGARIERGDVPTGRIAYNVLRKRAPRTPEITQRGMVSVSAIDTLPSIYARALEQQEERGYVRTEAQADLLARLVAKGDTFLSRREFFRSDAELDRWRREAFLDGSRMREARLDGGLVTRNPGHCTSAWSMPCVYRSVCLDPSAPELRESFRVAVETHEEITAAMTAPEPPF
jgi:hypothetical protein